MAFVFEVVLVDGPREVARHLRHPQRRCARGGHCKVVVLLASREIFRYGNTLFVLKQLRGVLSYS